MSSARSDLLLFIAAALATTVGLFFVHRWYASYIDMQYHVRLTEHGPAEALLAARDEDKRALAAGKLPLAQAMDTIAHQGRPASIAPVQSDDLSAVSGWIQTKGFKPATAHPVRGAKAAPREIRMPSTPAPTPAPVTPAPAPPGLVPPGSTAKPGTLQVAPSSSSPGITPLKLRTVQVKPEAVR